MLEALKVFTARPFSLSTCTFMWVKWVNILPLRIDCIRANLELLYGWGERKKIVIKCRQRVCVFVFYLKIYLLPATASSLSHLTVVKWIHVSKSVAEINSLVLSHVVLFLILSLLRWHVKNFQTNAHTHFTI